MTATKKFSALVTIGGIVSNTLKSALSTTTTKLGKLGGEVRKLAKEHTALGKEMKAFEKAGKDVSDLTKKYTTLTAELDKVRGAYKKLKTVQAQGNAFAAKGTNLKGYGMSTGIAGAVMLAPMGLMMGEAKHYGAEVNRMRALGKSPADTQAAISYARNIKQDGLSDTQKLELTRDSVSIFGSLEHAKPVIPMLANMMYANSAVFGKDQGEHNMQSFFDMQKVMEMRADMTNPAEVMKQLNMVQRVVSATGGRVGGSEWRNLISTGGLAAKGMDDEKFYYQLEHLVQEQGGDKVGTGLSAAYGNLYQGRTSKRAANNLAKYDLIGDKSKVVADGVGQVKFLDPGALKGAEIFKKSQYDWLKQILLPALAKKGITSESAVLDAIGSIFTNKKAADLFGTMYKQMHQMDKSEEANKSGYDVKQVTALADASVAGKEAIATAKLANVKKELGQTILPMYISALEKTADALQVLNDFIKANPNLTKVMAGGITVVGTALAVLAPIMITAGSTMYAMGTAASALGITVGALATGFVTIGAALGVFAISGYEVYKNWGDITDFMSQNWRDFAYVVFGTVGQIIGAVTNIYKHWGKTGSFFKDLWAGIVGTFDSAINDLKEKLGFIGYVWDELKAKFSGKHEAIIDNRMPKLHDALPVVPAAAAGAGAAGTTTVHNVINVHQTPGQDNKDLAKHIVRESAKLSAVKERSSLVDGVH